MLDEEQNARVAALFVRDLEVYLSQELKHRSVSALVAELNATARSESSPDAETARAALTLLKSGRLVSRAPRSGPSSSRALLP